MCKAQFPSQLVFTDLMGAITPETLGGLHYLRKLKDALTK